MPLKPGLMYRPTGITFDISNNAVYVVEQFNHRVSKWIYEEGFFVFSLADGNVTSLNGSFPTGTSGYTTALLVIKGPTGTAKADATVTTDEVTNIAITDGGSGYTTAPAVTITSVAGADATATANIINGIVTSITITNGGSGYVTATQVTPLVVIDAPEGKSRATGTATTSGGQITLATLTSNGNGYDEAAPDVSIVSDSGNSGDASVTATANTTPWGVNLDGTTGQGGTPTGPTDNFLYRPTGITINIATTRLYLTDTFNHRLRVIDPTNGAFLTSVGQGGTGDTNFYRPTGIDVNSADTILVIADEFNRRAVRYDAGANPTFNAILTEPTKKFVKPHGVSFDETQTEFIVSDTFRGLLSRYDDGTTSFIGQIGKAGGEDGDDELYFPGSGHGNPDMPELIFANTRRNSLKQLNTSSITNFLTGVAGTKDGQLYWPESSIAFTDVTPYLLTANTRNNRVEVFEQPTTFRNNFGSP